MFCKKHLKEIETHLLLSKVYVKTKMYGHDTVFRWIPSQSLLYTYMQVIVRWISKDLYDLLFVIVTFVCIVTVDTGSHKTSCSIFQ